MNIKTIMLLQYLFTHLIYSLDNISVLLIISIYEFLSINCSNNNTQKQYNYVRWVHCMSIFIPSLTIIVLLKNLILPSISASYKQ